MTGDAKTFIKAQTFIMTRIYRRIETARKIIHKMLNPINLMQFSLLGGLCGQTPHYPSLNQNQNQSILLLVVDYDRISIKLASSF